MCPSFCQGTNIRRGLNVSLNIAGQLFICQSIMSKDILCFGHCSDIKTNNGVCHSVMAKGYLTIMSWQKDIWWLCYGKMVFDDSFMTKYMFEHYVMAKGCLTTMSWQKDVWPLCHGKGILYDSFMTKYMFDYYVMAKGYLTTISRQKDIWWLCFCKRAFDQSVIAKVCLTTMS